MTDTANDAALAAFTASLPALREQHGDLSVAMLDMLVTMRESVTPESAVAASDRIDWTWFWDRVIGPALDSLENLLYEHGATNPADDETAASVTG